MGTLPGETDLIQQYLRDRTIGCPVCRYNLRGLTAGNCPECGARLELVLSANEMRLGWWMVGLLAAALPLGFCGILTATGAFGAWRSAFWGEEDWWIFGALCALTLFYAILLIRIVRRRPQFMRMSRLEQRVRAGGLALIMIALQVLLFYIFARYRPYW